MVKVAIDTFLALDDKTICLALPFLYQNGVQLEIQVIAGISITDPTDAALSMTKTISSEAGRRE